MSIQQLIIDPSLDYFEPIFRDNSLILTNVEALEDNDIKIEEYRIYTDPDDFDDFKGSRQPWKITLCTNCDGAGTHLRDSLRHVAFTDSDIDDPDFFYDMHNGVYDVTCNTCKGHGRYITITDVSDELKKILEEHYQAERDYRAEVEQERRMGC